MRCYCGRYTNRARAERDAQAEGEKTITRMFLGDEGFAALHARRAAHFAHEAQRAGGAR